MQIRAAHMIALALALALAGWLASGQLGAELTPPDAEREAAAVAEGPEPFAVRVGASEATPVQREVVVNAHTEAARDVEMRAETDGRVVEVGARRGAEVAAGDLLVRIDPREREALVRQAEATLRQRELQFEAATRLGQKGFQAETEVAAAEAALEAARAVLERARIDLRHTRITAPMAGTLELRPVEVGDFVDVGDPIATLIEQDPFLVVGNVAESEIGQLAPGMPGEVELITGDRVSGRISYIASRSDPATRTFRVELEVPNPDGRLRAGVSARLRIATEEVLAHRVPASLLALDDGGVLGIKAVDGDDRVSFHPARIVRAENDRLWLAGLPETLRVITVGQGFVREGDPVRVNDGGALPLQAPLVAERSR